jgi:hypothetical protein
LSDTLSRVADDYWQAAASREPTYFRHLLGDYSEVGRYEQASRESDVRPVRGRRHRRGHAPPNSPDVATLRRYLHSASRIRPSPSDRRLAGRTRPLTHTEERVSSRTEPGQARLRPKGMSPGASARFLGAVAIVWSLVACDSDSDPVGQTSSQSRGGELGVLCEVTLTQADNVQVVRLRGSPHDLSLASTAPIAVDIEGSCPDDLDVAGAVVSGSGDIRFGEQTDGTRPLVLNSETTHLALIYQPCTKNAPGCFGPQEHRMFPVQLQP